MKGVGASSFASIPFQLNPEWSRFHVASQFGCGGCWCESSTKAGTQ